MRALEKREKTLLGVFAVLGLIAVWRLLASGGGPLAPTGPARRSPVQVTAAQARVRGLPDLELDRGREVAYEAQRDLFDYARCPVDIEAERARAEQVARQRRAALERQQQRAAQREQREAAVARHTEEVQSRARAPDPRFSCIGYFGELEDRIAVFLMDNAREDEDSIVLAKVGEVVEQEFVVQKIDWDGVVLGFSNPEFQSANPKILPIEGGES